MNEHLLPNYFKQVLDKTENFWPGMIFFSPPQGWFIMIDSLAQLAIGQTAELSTAAPLPGDGSADCRFH